MNTVTDIIIAVCAVIETSILIINLFSQFEHSSNG